MAENKSKAREQMKSIDLSDEVELDSEFSSEPLIPVDHGSELTVDGLFAITGENGVAQEDYRQELHALAAPRRRAASVHGRVPSLSIPTPFEVGPRRPPGLPPRARTNATAEQTIEKAAEHPLDRPDSQRRSIPPPLPVAGNGTGSPLPAVPLGTVASPTSTGGAASYGPQLAPLPSPPLSLSKPPPPLAAARKHSELASVLELATSHLEALEPAPGEKAEDPVALGRVRLEVAVLAELLGDDARASSELDHALREDPRLAFAHAMQRRRQHGRAHVGRMLEHLDVEIPLASVESATVELLCERARLLRVAGAEPAEVRAAWRKALERMPAHPAALKGLEAELANDDGDILVATEFASHLGQMADAYAGQRELAGWFERERAEILEFKLGKPDEARAALERAVLLDPNVGPIRRAYVQFLCTHEDYPTLVAMLDEEAQVEHDSARAAELEFDAARIATLKLNDDGRAIALLERAAARTEASAELERRVLDELVVLYEVRGLAHDAARTRRRRLRFVGTSALELKKLAAQEERLGNTGAAILDLARARELDMADATTLESLDRLLAAAGRHEDRLGLWLDEAARNRTPKGISNALLKAARLAGDGGFVEDARKHLRGAFERVPNDSEVVDELARLLTPARGEEILGPTRQVVELYERAAKSAVDSERKIAYLERAALLWEEVLLDQSRARALYEEALEAEPARRTAILGLARTSARLNDHRNLAKALMAEAALAASAEDARDLCVRAAQTLSDRDPTRALAIVTAALEEDPSHLGARTLEVRLHEDAGRYDAAAESMRARLAHTESASDKVPLLLALSHLLDSKLGATGDAVAVLEQARATDPTHADPPIEIARILTKKGDDLALRAALENLGQTAASPSDRARHLLAAGEVCEFRLADDGSAARLYVQALVESPEDTLIAARLSRVLARKAHRQAKRVLPEQITLLTKRLERAQEVRRRNELSFELAEMLRAAGQDNARATTLLESVLEVTPAHAGALRTLETVARETSAHSLLARVLGEQGARFVDVRARISALAAQAFVDEWRAGTDTTSFDRILLLDPTEPGALCGTLRRSMPLARRGDERAQQALLESLRALCILAGDDTARALTELTLGFALEGFGRDKLPALQEALIHYDNALAIDNDSISAASSLARLANKLVDGRTAIAAATALADLSKARPKVRARYLFDAASLLLSDSLNPTDSAIGEEEARRERAGHLLEQALEADANSIAVAGALATLRQENGEHVRIVDILQRALARATETEAIVMLGAEIAAVAREELHDLSIAIAAMLKVRHDAPDHLPSLMTLAELYIEAREWNSAIEALELVAAKSRPGKERMTALFALARIYEDVQERKGEAERVLRQCVAEEPQNSRALRALLRRLVTKRQENDAPSDHRSEMAELIFRLSELEGDRAQRSLLLLELAELRHDLGELHLAERALIDAVAYAPLSRTAFSKLARFFKEDPAAHARALTQIVAKGRELGTKSPAWFRTLGKIEIDKLGRPRDGIPHLTQAIRMDPNLHEARYELAAARARIGANDEACKTLLDMLSPDPAPLLAIASPQAALDLLERTLGAERRSEEAIVVSELRAVAGDLDEGRYAWLRSRRISPLEAHHTPLDRAALVKHAVPEEAQHTLLDVAAAVAGLEAKVLRADLTDLGITPKDRIGSRSGHPMRVLLDRLASALSVTDVELVISPTTTRTRVLIQDEPWIVVSKKIESLPEPTQLATLARALGKVALNIPWLEELSPPHIEAYLVACARQVVPAYGEQDIDVLSKRLVQQYEPLVAKALSRKHRQALEKLMPRLMLTSERLPSIDAFTAGLARAELRVAYLLTGDLLATVDELRGLDAAFLRATATPGREALAALLGHPYAGSVSRFALAPETTALRRRVGTTWTR